MITLSVAICALEDVLTKLHNNAKVADAREGRVLVHVSDLKDMSHKLEEVFAVLQMEYRIMQICDLHGARDNIILPPDKKMEETIIVNLNDLWNGDCPICGNEYEEIGDGSDICPLCGFPIKHGWEKNIEKIKHWAYHFSSRRGNMVGDWIDPFSPLRMD